MNVQCLVVQLNKPTSTYTYPSARSANSIHPLYNLSVHFRATTTTTFASFNDARYYVRQSPYCITQALCERAGAPPISVMITLGLGISRAKSVCAPRETSTRRLPLRSRDKPAQMYRIKLRVSAPHVFMLCTRFVSVMVRTSRTIPGAFSRWRSDDDDDTDTTSRAQKYRKHATEVIESTRTNPDSVCFFSLYTMQRRV